MSEDYVIQSGVDTITIGKYRDGVGWTVSASSLERALELHRELSIRLGGEPGYLAKVDSKEESKEKAPVKRNSFAKYHAIRKKIRT